MTRALDLRPVVVGVDGSERAAQAARLAAEEARLRSAPLRVVHAAAWPIDGPAAPADPAVLGALRDGAESLVSAVAEAVGELAGPSGVGTQVIDGDPVAVLRELSGEAQLLVLGSRGVGGVAGLLVGSTASAVVTHARCPVIALPDEDAALVSARRSVVVGVEGRPGDEEVLAVAFAEAAARDTDLVAVHAWQDVVLETAFRSVSPLVDWAGVLADEQRVLVESLAGWRDKEPDVEVREVVVRDRPARALVAASMTAHLVVVGHRPRWALGSTTHGLLHRATCPVAVVPIGLPRDDRAHR